MAAQPEIRYSACPHDCPSTCALEVERLGDRLIGKVRGARENTYTAGVICSKVARYAERIHHPDRLTTPLRRTGEKGSADSFVPVAWDDALDIVAESLLKAEQRHGSEAVWPYYYAGTMGLVMRDGIHRLRHVKRYSGQHSTICVTLAWNGFIAGTGRLAGADPREMAKSDLVIIWGTNAASTQVNVMTHALEARRRRGAPVVVDRHLPQRDREAGRSLRVRASRHRRRARLRGDARAVPRRPREPRLPRPLHRLPGRPGASPRGPVARNGRNASPGCRRIPSSGWPG